MKITLAEWLKFAKLKESALTTLNDLSFILENAALDHSKAGHKEEATHLLDCVEKVHDAKRVLLSFDTNCQSEWMGGPTSGPGSERTKTYMREPDETARRHGKAARHFTAAEVQEAKDKGLLKGGPDLTGPEVSS